MSPAKAGTYSPLHQCLGMYMGVWDRVSTPFILSQLLFGNKEDVSSSGMDMGIVIVFRTQFIQNLD